MYFVTILGSEKRINLFVVDGESLPLHGDKHFMATTEGWLQSISPNGLKRANPLVIDAKFDPTQIKNQKQSFLKFHHVCLSSEALRLVVSDNLLKIPY